MNACSMASSSTAAPFGGESSHEPVVDRLRDRGHLFGIGAAVDEPAGQQLTEVGTDRRVARVAPVDGDDSVIDVQEVRRARVAVGQRLRKLVEVPDQRRHDVDHPTEVGAQLGIGDECRMPPRRIVGEPGQIELYRLAVPQERQATTFEPELGRDARRRPATAQPAQCRRRALVRIGVPHASVVDRLEPQLDLLF